MPANSRWDLIRRLRVNAFLSTVVHNGYDYRFSSFSARIQVCMLSSG